MSAKGALYLRFWTRFLERVHVAYPSWTKSTSAGTNNWFEMKSPIRGCRISSSFAQHDRLRHELYIDSGDAERNTQLYEFYLGHQEQLEVSYGRKLSGRSFRPRRRAESLSTGRDATSAMRIATTSSSTGSSMLGRASGAPSMVFRRRRRLRSGRAISSVETSRSVSLASARNRRLAARGS